jgi:hypothetical protein
MLMNLWIYFPSKGVEVYGMDCRSTINTG